MDEKRKYKGIIFDLDGTLLDTIEDICNSLNRILDRHFISGFSIEYYRKNVGNGIKGLLLNLLRTENFDKEFMRIITEEFIHEYYENCCMATRLYPGIADLLDELTKRKIKLSILSNKLNFITQKITQHYLGEWKFEVILGESKDFPKKPGPSGALFILKNINLTEKEILFVGDSEIDIETAENIGAFSVGVTWGYRDKSILVDKKADMLIDNPKELCMII